MPGSIVASRGTGPRATIKTARYRRRRPSDATRAGERVPLAIVRADRAIAGDRPPRYGEKNPYPSRRARALACHTRRRAGSPRHRSRNPTIAGDRPPRYGKTTPSLHVGLGPSPATRAGERVPLAIVRADRAIAGDRPPRYGEKNPYPSRRARACPSPCCGPPDVRGGLSPALREHRDPRSLLPGRH